MDESEYSTEDLISAINVLLQTKRSTLPADAEQLLRLARDELKSARCDPPNSGLNSSAVARALRFLLMGFAREEVIDQVGDLDERIGTVVDQLSEFM